MAVPLQDILGFGIDLSLSFERNTLDSVLPKCNDTFCQLTIKLLITNLQKETILHQISFYQIQVLQNRQHTITSCSALLYLLLKLLSILTHIVYAHLVPSI